jgi:ABC-type amino acid transport substrate-binding protein
MRRLLVVLVVLVALLAVADRVGVVVAQSVLASQIQDQLQLDQTPDVSIRGIPFLTQAIRGTYRDVRVTLPDVDAGALQNIAVDAQLRGVHVPLSDAIRRQVNQVPVDRISGTLEVGYDELARASGISGLKITRDGDSLRLSGSVQVLGRQLEASAVGRVEVDGDNININAERAEVAGIPVPQTVLDAAARLLSFRVSPTNLPLSLRITSVDVGQDGLLVSAVSDDVVLRPEDVQVN